MRDGVWERRAVVRYHAVRMGLSPYDHYVLLNEQNSYHISCIMTGIFPSLFLALVSHTRPAPLSPQTGADSSSME
jgi:hypothetical protein